MPPYCLRARPCGQLIGMGEPGLWSCLASTPFMLAATTIEKRAMPLSNSKDAEGKGL